MNILGKHVVLRAIEERDLPVMHTWANDPEMWHWLGSWHFPTNFDSLKTWFSGLKNDALNQRFAVELIDNGELIGSATLVDIDWKNSHAYQGLMLGKTHRGRGYGTDVVMALMRYAFDELGLNRLETDIIEYNEASLRLYLSECGWREEGRLRQWHHRKGRYWDKVMAGVLREEYYAQLQNKPYWD